MKVKIKRQFLKYLNYKIKLFRIGRIAKPYYKIVVVNWNNRIVSQIGYFNPHADGKQHKIIGLDRSATLRWLLIKKATPSCLIFLIFEKLGIIKY